MHRDAFSRIICYHQHSLFPNKVKPQATPPAISHFLHRRRRWSLKHLVFTKPLDPPIPQSQQLPKTLENEIRQPSSMRTLTLSQSRRLSNETSSMTSLSSKTDSIGWKLSAPPI
ncbi:hypothetical protein L1987_29039 [Smallanthus sonchifolius]|uniref:Uncharacterized protein n=1 Tax=Smallanthus sonchifolius TaxID=185202 RepID=A0ACB9HYT3_9ASTR|nr:hypothetical protein L1987_29039 [Smallanthus sonchifolius]